MNRRIEKNKFASLPAKNFSGWKKLCLFLAILFLAPCVYSNPQFNSVTAGNVSINQTTNSTVVNQGSQKAIIQWNSFNIGANQKTQFIQPNASSIALNRIDPNQGISKIYGSLIANGRLILVNGAGIYFGPTAQVNVAGIIASTSDISDANFLNGKYIFDQPSLFGGSITNEGKIIAAEHGLVALLGSNVTNTGLISARMGSIALGSGDKFTLDFNGDQLINFTVDAPASKGGQVKNSGTLLADGGQILVTARQAQGVLDDAISMDGVAQTRSVHQHNGVIILDGGTGNVTVSGKLIATGKHNNKGGTVKVLGNNLLLTSNATIDVSGNLGGGQIVIGGDFHGAGPDQNATSTIVNPGAMLKADAITNGNGGNIVVWSNEYTLFQGSLSAQGGSLGGDGGFIETSSHNYLDINGASVNTLAAKGKTGMWLLDPANVNISGSVDSGENYSAPNYTPTSGSSTSNIQASNLIAALASSSVTVTTINSGTAGVGVGSINVQTPITWSSGNTLTLTANPSNTLGAITINAAITNTGSGGLTLQATDSTIAINAAITLATGTLTLAAANTAASITTNASGVINVGNFVLSQGEWSQSGTLPGFTVKNNFQIASGTAFNSIYNAQFLRVTGGAGSSASPYLISDVYGLQGIGTQTLSNFYKLNNNIDATVTSNWNSGAGFIPIAATFAFNSGFTGNINGNGLVISNLFINSSALESALIASGVASSTAPNVGLVQNLGLVNANITNTASSGFAAGFVGILYGDNNVTAIGLNNVYVTGSIAVTNATGQAAGLVARMGGGAANNGVVIENSYNAATVSGGFNVAGLVAAYLSGTIQDSYNIGAITTAVTNGIAGGISGQGCGGCAGGVEIMTRTYNSGSVTATGTGTLSVSAIMAQNNGSGAFNNNFYDNQTSGGATVPAGQATGMTTAQMMTLANFNSATAANGNVNPGWNITSSSSTTPNNSVWFIAGGGTRPILISEEFISNTADAIQNGHQLQLISANLAGTYSLGKNIDLSSQMNNLSDVWGTNAATVTGGGFVPIGNGTVFTGSLNGENFAINNLYINNSTSTNIGLFWTSGASASLLNLGLTNVNITCGTAGGGCGGIAGQGGAGTYTGLYVTGKITDTVNGSVGGIFGAFNGTLSLSFNAASVTSTYAGTSANAIGGITGNMWSNASIANSYNTGNITSGTGNANNYIGGIVGSFNVLNTVGTNTITNTYSSGLITGGGHIGGLVGATSGAAATVTNSFFDTSTSNQTAAIGSSSSGSSGNAGYTTPNMMLAANFTSWAFGSTWAIISGSSYPYLASIYTTTPRVISGYIPGGSLAATGFGGITVNLASAGSNVVTSGLSIGSVLTGVNGFYYFLESTSAIADGSAILTYLPNGFANSVDVAPTSTGSITGLNMTANTVTVGDSSGMNSACCTPSNACNFGCTTRTR